MLIRLLILLLAAPALAFAGAPSAESAYRPPLAKSAYEAELHPIPQTVLRQILAHWRETRVFRDFEGVNDLLKTAPPDGVPGVLYIGEHMPVDLAPEDLFYDHFVDQGGAHGFLAAVQSADAEGLRLEVDLSLLGPGNELWLIDPHEPRAFGPYTETPPGAGPVWLPVTEGDTAVLYVRAQTADTPLVWVRELSHIYRSTEDVFKVLDCHVNVACDTRSGVEDLASAVGRVVISSDGRTGLCSGALVNNPNSPGFDPLFLTANHCVGSAAQARSTEVIWDYRAGSCGSDRAPSLSSLPRSRGSRLLSSSATLDASLMLLDNVPVGTHGRTYAGWDTRTPTIGEAVFNLHHSSGSHMRISYGTVTAINQRASLGGFSADYRNQIRVGYTEGVTEGGASGSGLFYDDGEYKLMGLLSNGPVHSCDSNNNWDRFASFRHFYEEIKVYLTSEDGVPDDPGGPSCPAGEAFKNDPEMLEKLRELRDNGLLSSHFGQAAANAYYRAAPYLAPMVRASDMAAAALRGALRAAASASSPLLPAG